MASAVPGVGMFSLHGLLLYPIRQAWGTIWGDHRGTVAACAFAVIGTALAMGLYAAESGYPCGAVWKNEGEMQSRIPASQPLQRTSTRRTFLAVAAGTFASTLLAACGQRMTEQSASSPVPFAAESPVPLTATPAPTTAAVLAPTEAPAVAAPTENPPIPHTDRLGPMPSPAPLPPVRMPITIVRGVPSSGAKAVFFGDSITDPGLYGQYASIVCQRYGWTLTNANPFSLTRAGIRGTLLQANDMTPYNGMTTFPQRVWSFNPDVIVMFYGVNDYYYVSGSPTPTTPATWRAAVRTILTAFRALPSRPFIMVVGLPTLRLRLHHLPAWATSEGDVQRQMDTITWEECAQIHATFVPLRPAMPITDVLADGVHPTPLAGQPFIASQIIKAIEGT